MERWFLILVAALLVWTTSAHADTKVVVRSFSGPGGASVRRAVVKQLEGMKGIRVVDEAKAERVAKRRSVSLEGAAREEVARELGIAAWVEGRIKKKGGKVQATISVVDASSGDEAGAWTLARKKPKQLEQAVKQSFKKELRDAFSNVSAPAGGGGGDDADEESDAEEAPYERPAASDDETPTESFQPVAQAKDDEDALGGSFASNDEMRIDGDDAAPTKRGKDAIFARAGAGMLHRTLKYNEAFTQNIGDYTLGAAPLADVGLRIYPGAFFSDGWASYIGLDLHGQFAFGLASETSDGTRYDTTYREYDASVIGRYPLGAHEVHGAVGYQAQTFAMRDKGGEDAPIPDVDYRAIRAGLGGRFELMRGYHIGLDAHYLALMSLGEIATAAWFPRATGGGFEALMYVDAQLYKSLSGRLYGSYQRQFFDFKSQADDARIAGGAVDQYLVAGLSVGYTY